MKIGEKCLVKVRILGTSPKPVTLTHSCVCIWHELSHIHMYLFMWWDEATAAAAAITSVAPLITIISEPLSNSQTLSERWRKRKNYKTVKFFSFKWSKQIYWHRFEASFAFLFSSINNFHKRNTLTQKHAQTQSQNDENRKLEKTRET